MLLEVAAVANIRLLAHSALVIEDFHSQNIIALAYSALLLPCELCLLDCGHSGQISAANIMDACSCRSHAFVASSM